MKTNDRFTMGAKRVLLNATEEASLTHQEYVQPHHLLIALAQTRNIGAGIAFDAIREFKINPKRIRDVVLQLEEPGKNVDGKPKLSPETVQALENAADAARRFGAGYRIGPEYLLLGVIKTEGTIQTVLKELGTNPDTIKRIFLEKLNQNQNPLSKIMNKFNLFGF